VKSWVNLLPKEAKKSAARWNRIWGGGEGGGTDDSRERKFNAFQTTAKEGLLAYRGGATRFLGEGIQ